MEQVVGKRENFEFLSRKCKCHSQITLMKLKLTRSGSSILMISCRSVQISHTDRSIFNDSTLSKRQCTNFIRKIRNVDYISPNISLYCIVVFDCIYISCIYEEQYSLIQICYSQMSSRIVFFLLI